MKQFIIRMKETEQGQAMLEFALALPVIFLVAFATMEAGWYFVNYNSVKLIAKNAVYEIKEPVYADWGIGGDWNYGGIPSWEAGGGAGLASYSSYDAWLPFGLSYAGDSAEDLKRRLQEKSGLINLDEAEIVINGGWLLRTMAADIPGDTGTEVRTEPRTGVYYADIYVSVKYKYYPLTYVGGMIFCGGTGAKELSSKERVTYQLGSS